MGQSSTSLGVILIVASVKETLQALSLSIRECMGVKGQRDFWPQSIEIV